MADSLDTWGVNYAFLHNGLLGLGVVFFFVDRVLLP